MAELNSNPLGRVEKSWVPPSAMYTANEAIALLRIRKRDFYALASREGDPLLLRRFECRSRYSVVTHDELMEWVKRNLPLVADLKDR